MESLRKIIRTRTAQVGPISPESPVSEAEADMPSWFRVSGDGKTLEVDLIEFGKATEHGIAAYHNPEEDPGLESAEQIDWSEFAQKLTAGEAHYGRGGDQTGLNQQEIRSIADETDWWAR